MRAVVVHGPEDDRLEERPVPVSRELAPQVAAFAEPLSCAFHAVERAEIRFDDTVVVAGAGAIGLSAVAGARQKNPRRLIALDVLDEKLELAKKVGDDMELDIRGAHPGPHTWPAAIT
jgi:threonine dehydrogenase-like Zn-dependent dehydrogenase